MTILMLIVAVCAMTTAIVFLSMRTPSNPYMSEVKADKHHDDFIRDSLFAKVQGDRIVADLRVVSKEHHLSGSEANKKVAEYIIQRYSSIGYHVRTFDYQVMTSSPNWTEPNTIHMIESDGSWELISDGLGERVGPDEAQKQMNDKTTLWWNSYSANGEVTSKVVYCNRGEPDDWQWMYDNSISVSGAIALIRMGRNWRGNKVQGALERGAVGVILYMDPEDYAKKGQNFPNGMYEPPTDAQRGSTKNLWGDILSPVYPSKEYVFRSENELDLRKSRTIPNAPVQTISYAHAIKIMENMNGLLAPESFIGKMNVTYRLNGTTQFRLTVHSSTEHRQPIQNICAFVYGSHQPDYMYFSNHYDSYTNGALDPNSGTVMQMEVARSLMTTVNETGWKPRRTQVFCHWDAEEYGLLGSGEWVQEMEKLLNLRAVALVNTDMALYGNVTLDVEGTPQLLRSMIAATSKVSNPNPEEFNALRKTVYDSWKYWFPANLSQPGLDPPMMYVPGAGSDHYAFMTFGAVPVISFMYANKGQWDSFKLYHSMYEVPWTVENLVDRGNHTLAAMAKITLELDRLLTDSPVIPFNLLDYVKVLDFNIDLLGQYLFDMKISEKLWQPLDVIVRNLKNSTENLRSNVQILQQYADDINSGRTSASIRLVDQLNSRMVAFEKQFQAAAGVYTGRPNGRHVVFTTGEGVWAGGLFNGVREPVYRWYYATNKEDGDLWLKQTQISLTQLNFCIESAAELTVLFE